MSTIFISHSSRDNAAAEALCSRLKAENHSLFLDFDAEKGIAPGRDWAKELYRRLRLCQAVIVLCSEHSMASMWCFAEIIHAESLGKPIFPIRVGPCEIHPILARYQILDPTAPEGEEAAYRRLTRGLEAAGLDPEHDFAWDESRSPYPGLPAFEEQDARVYFGRDAEIQKGLDVLQRLRQLGGARTLLVLGASGSGKSSLVRAGLVPRLKRNPREWLVVPSFRPQQRPSKELSIALSQAFAEHGGNRSWKEILQRLEPTPISEEPTRQALGDLVLDLQEAAGERQATVLLVLDQAEELLGRADDAAESFLEPLEAALKAEDSRVMLIATLRSDFLAAFQQHPAAGRLELENLHLAPMSKENLLEVIEGPARIADLELEEGLARRMVAAAATQDALPLLAFTLRELYEGFGKDGMLEIEEYEQLGELEGSVARSAEKLLSAASLTAAAENRLRDALLAMVRLDEDGHFARRTVAWDKMPEGARALLGRFVEARLLIARDDDGQQVLEVAHEALFRSWDRLRGWLDEARELLLWRKRLGSRLEEWHRTGRDPSALLVGPSLVEGRAWLARREHQLDDDELELVRESVRLDDQKRELERRRQATIRSRQLALQSRAVAASNHELALLLAIESSRAAESIEAEGALRSALLHPWQTRRLLTGHGDHVVEVSWDPGGRRLLSASLDGTAVIWDAETGKQLRVLRAHKAKVWQAAWSPDGESILTVSLDGTARLWNAASGRTRRLLKGHRAPLTQGAWSDDGRLVVTAGTDNTARIWDAIIGAPWSDPLEHDDFVRCVAWSSDRLATAGFGHRVRIWNQADGKPLAALSGHTHALRHLEWSADGRRLLSASDDGTVRLWDAAGGRLLTTLEGHGNQVVHASWSPAEDRILSVSRDGSARIWDPEKAKQLRVLLGHDGELTRGAWSPEGRRVATSGVDGTARVWGAASGDLLAVLTGHQQGIVSLAWAPDGSRLATSSLDHTVRLWSPGEGSRKLAEVSSVIWRASWSPDGERVATACQDGLTEIRGIDGDAPSTVLGARGVEALDVAWSPGGGQVAAACGDGSGVIWDAARGERLATLKGHSSSVRRIVWAADGRRLATAGRDACPRLWSASGSFQGLLEGHTGWVQHVAWSPDDQCLATASLDGTVRFWDPEHRKELRRLEGHSSAVLYVAWSPDGRRIASASSDRTVRVWDARTGELRSLLAGHRSWIYHLEWSRDGRRLASAGRDGLARIWDPDSESEPIGLHGHQGPVRQVRWRPPNDARLLTVGDDGTARLWSPEGDQIAVLEGHEGRLTHGEWHPRGSHVLTAGFDATVRVFFSDIRDLMAEADRRAVRNMSREEWRLYMGGPYRATCAGIAERDPPAPATAPVPPAARRVLGDGDQAMLGGIILVDSPWGDAVAAGMRAGAEQMGAELILKRHHFDFGRETDFIQDFIDLPVDGLVMVPQREEESVFMLKQAHEAGLVVVNIAISLNPRDTERYVSAFYESDNMEVGYRTGAFMAEWAARNGIPLPLRIGILHSGIYDVSYRRGVGFRAALEDAGVRWNEAVSLQGIEFDEAAKAVLRIVEEHPEVDIVWSDNSENTLGALRGLKGAKRRVHLFGTEINREVAEALLEPGPLEAVTSQATFEMSQRAVRAAVEILRGTDTGHHHRIMESILYTRERPEEVERFLTEDKTRMATPRVETSTLRLKPPRPAASPDELSS